MEDGEEIFKFTVKLTFLKLIIDHAEKAANGGSRGAVSPRLTSRLFLEVLQLELFHAGWVAHSQVLFVFSA